MNSHHDAWQKTLKLLPWIVIFVGIAGTLRGLYAGVWSNINTATVIGGIITWWIGTVWLYCQNRQF